MKILLILLLGAILVIAFLATELCKDEKTIKEYKARDYNSKTIKVSYTITESDLYGHKPKKLPAVARKILNKELAIEMAAYFKYMDKDEVNGYTRYSQTFHIRQETK